MLTLPPEEDQREFTQQQVEELAGLIDRSGDDLRVEIQRAARSIWMFRYTLEPTASVQRAALAEIVAELDGVRAKLAGVDLSVKRRILHEYAAEIRESCSPDTPPARYHAQAQYDADLRALHRLYSSIATAAKVVAGKSILGEERSPGPVVKSGAPKKDLERHGVRRLVGVYETVSGESFVNDRRHKSRLFVVTALSMFGITGSAVGGALREFAKDRKNGLKNRTNKCAE